MPEEKEYLVEMSALALVKGSLYIKAKSQKDAEQQALAQTGDVSWSYQGVDDTSVDAHAELHN